MSIMTLQIDPEFRALIPPLTAEERQQLEANIVRDGCRDALVVWNDILLDGHHRYEICTAHSISFQTSEQACADRDAAKLWILQHQLGRRNLLDYQRAELVMQLEPLRTAEAKRRQLDSLKQFADSPLASKEANGKTTSQLAQIAGISEQSMQRSMTVIKRGSPELQEEVRTGKTSLTRAAARVRAGEAIKPPRRQPKKPVPEQREEEQVIQAIAEYLTKVIKELHERRVANDDDMNKSRWNPHGTNVWKQKEMLDWIHRTLETLATELHAGDHQAFLRLHPRVPKKSRTTASTGA
jgi:hypothetical protein